jgi:hypothetical protein
LGTAGTVTVLKGTVVKTSQGNREFVTTADAAFVGAALGPELHGAVVEAVVERVDDADGLATLALPRTAASRQKGDTMYWIGGTPVLKPAERTSTGQATSAAIDLETISGTRILALHSDAASAGTTPTLNAKVQHCDTEEGEFTDSGVAFAEITDEAESLQFRVLDPTAVKRWIKLIGVIAGTDTPTFVCEAALLGVELQG